MGDKQQTTCLFFPEPLDATDEGNLLESGVLRVQLFYGVASNKTEELTWLASKGRSVILRLEEPNRDNGTEIATSYYNGVARGRITERVSELADLVAIEAVIIGNEPEFQYDLTRGSKNWGNKGEPYFPEGRVFAHQYALNEMREELASIGIASVAPGWTHKRIVPRDTPQPGRAMWGRVCTEAYNKCKAGGIHAYQHDWASHEDENRVLWWIGNELERVHTEAWWNEGNANKRAMTQVQRMGACLGMFDIVDEQPWGDTFTSRCPFVSNGRLDQEWSHMIMRDRICYTVLGQWMITP